MQLTTSTLRKKTYTMEERRGRGGERRGMVYREGRGTDSLYRGVEREDGIKTMGGCKGGFVPRRVHIIEVTF